MEEIAIRAYSIQHQEGSSPGNENRGLVNSQRRIFMLADGFGGPEVGSEASKVVCDSVLQFLEREAGDQDATLPFELRNYLSLAGNILFNSIVFANQKLMNINDQKSYQQKGGASVVAGYLDGSLLALANAGNCTGYLLREKNCEELLMPRSYARLLNPTKNLVDPGLDIPLTAAGLYGDLEPEIVEYRVQHGDWVLLETAGVDPRLHTNLLKLKEKNIKPGSLETQIQDIIGMCHFPRNSSFSLIIL